MWSSYLVMCEMFMHRFAVITQLVALGWIVECWKGAPVVIRVAFQVGKDNHQKTRQMKL